MSQTTVYQALPAGVAGFAEKHPDILELFGAWVVPVPIPTRDLPELLREVKKDASILDDYGLLTLQTFLAFAASPHTAVLSTLVPELSIDKAGPGIHFLLTGTADLGKPPLGDLILGGKELLPAVSLVPHRLLTPPQVLAIAQALTEVDVGDLKSRYDPDRMSGLRIYPDNIWTRDDDALDWLLEHYDALIAYVLEAASRRHALVISTTL
jgi:hypothetical protein